MSQQLSTTVARTLYQRLTALFPEGDPSPANVAALDDATLQRCGLSARKIKSIRDLVRHAEGGSLPDAATLATLTDEEIIHRLTTIYGIGRWSVEMLLLRMGRLDILPASDLGIRKGVQRLDGGLLPSPSAVTARGERWRPYRSIASWYLWESLTLAPPPGKGAAP